VLIVDDDEAVAIIMKTVLEQDLGVEVAVAKNGQDALRMAAQLYPALVILDLRLPGMDGLEVLRQLKDAVATRAIPVIVCSALPAGCKRAVEIGSDGCVEKPFDLDALVETVRGHLQHRRPPVAMVPAAAR
jgi:DNA-binding response OmpR family regulator